MDPELRAFLEAMEQRLVERMATKNDVEALCAEVRAGDEESRRHMDVLYEKTRHEMGLVIDQVKSLGEHIERSDEERKSEYRPSCTCCNRASPATRNGWTTTKNA